MIGSCYPPLSVSPSDAPRRLPAFSESPMTPSSVRVDLGMSSLALEQGLQYKLNVHLRLNVFYDVPNFTWTEPGLLVNSAKFVPGGELIRATPTVRQQRVI